MFSNRLAFGVLAAACIASAAAGGYLATLGSAKATPVANAAAPSVGSGATPAKTPATTPVAAVTVPVAGQLAEKTAFGQVEKDDPAADRGPVAGSMPKRSAEQPPVTAGTAAPPSSARTGSVQAAKRTETPVRAPAASRPVGPAPANLPVQDTPIPALPDRQVANTNAGATIQAPPVPLPSSSTTPDPIAVPIAHPEDRSFPIPEPPGPPDPPAKIFDELVVSADSVIGLQTDSTISSERAQIEDRVDAHVSRDVRVGGRVAIPSGTRVVGSVIQVDRGGKFKTRAHLGIRFHTIEMADGTRLPISTEIITRDGEQPSSAQKIGGGAVAGAILGAILGGSKGAAIGGAAGAGAGAAASAAADRNAAMLYAGEPITVRMLSSVTVSLEK